MKIIAKQGSELEKLLKQMNEQLLREHEEAKDMIQEYCGLRPEKIGYMWFAGWTAEFSYNLLGYNEITSTNNKLVKNESDNCWKLNPRLKATKALMREWHKKFKGINGTSLNQFGIPVMHEGTGRYFHWMPLHFDGRYYISTSSVLLDLMPKLDDKQYEIEL